MGHGEEPERTGRRGRPVRSRELTDVEAKPELGQLQNVGFLFWKKRHEFSFGVKYDLPCH